jgi:hypothetical protein
MLARSCQRTTAVRRDHRARHGWSPPDRMQRGAGKPTNPAGELTTRAQSSRCTFKRSGSDAGSAAEAYRGARAVLAVALKSTEKSSAPRNVARKACAHAHTPSAAELMPSATFARGAARGFHTILCGGTHAMPADCAMADCTSREHPATIGSRAVAAAHRATTGIESQNWRIMATPGHARRPTSVNAAPVSASARVDENARAKREAELLACARNAKVKNTALPPAAGCFAPPRASATAALRSATPGDPQSPRALSAALLTATAPAFDAPPLRPTPSAASTAATASTADTAGTRCACFAAALAPPAMARDCCKAASGRPRAVGNTTTVMLATAGNRTRCITA